MGELSMRLPNSTTCYRFLTEPQHHPDHSRDVLYAIFLKDNMTMSLGRKARRAFVFFPFGFPCIDANGYDTFFGRVPSRTRSSGCFATETLMRFLKEAHVCVCMHSLNMRQQTFCDGWRKQGEAAQC